MRISSLIFLSALLILAAGSVDAQSTFGKTEKYAYSANAGWVSFRHDQPAVGDGISFGEYYLSGFAYAANIGWIHFGDGSPANLIRYKNTSGTDYGVNHDGAGNLYGYAYSANVGWISFEWAGAADPNRPRVNLLTGAFSGYAYSANIGWIHLGTGLLTTDTMVITDTDGDGIADQWEQEEFFNLTTATPVSDFDLDGASDVEEYRAGTDPRLLSDVLRILSNVPTSSSLDKTVLTFTSKTNRVYQILTGDAPDNLSDSGLGVFSPSSGASTAKTVTLPGTTPIFLRVLARQPLQP